MPASAAVEDARVAASRCRADSPRTSAAAVSAPRPANAIWPSESCPAQPVSTTTDTAQIANARIVAQVWWRADCVDEQRQRRPRRASATTRDELRHAPHPPDLAQPFGHRGDARREREALAAGAVVAAADTRDEHEHDEEEHELHEAGLGREVEEEHPVEDADDDRAERRRAGTTTMPPIERRGQPRSSVSGPMCTRSVEPCVGGGEDHRDASTRKPAIVQTAVDTSFGLMPVMPGEVGVRRRRPAPRRRTRCGRAATTGRRVMSGTTMSTSSWLAVTSMSSAGMPRARERQRELRLQRAGAVFGQRERDRLAQLRDADRRDEHDDARRLEQPADHGELDRPRR